MIKSEAIRGAHIHFVCLRDEGLLTEMPHVLLLHLTQRHVHLCPSTVDRYVAVSMGGRYPCHSDELLSAEPFLSQWGSDRDSRDQI